MVVDDPAAIQPAPDLSGEAVRLAEAGLHVFPCEARNKRPLTTHGLRDARADPELVGLAWEHYGRSSNIGVSCGPSGIWVLDCDGEAGERSLAELCAGRPIYTAVVRTARGRHYWFRGEGVGTRAGVRPGLDTRGRGGYVIAPPSIHASGAVYQWEVPLDDLAEAPDWLLEALRPREAPAGSQERTARAGRALEPAEVSRVESALSAIPADEYQVWVEAGMGLHDATAGGEQGFLLWQRWSASSAKYPGTDALLRKWASFGRGERRNPLGVASIYHRAQGLGWRAPADLPLAPAQSPIELVHAAPRRYATTAPPPERWIVDGLIPRGKLGFLGAPGGAGKSELVAHLAVALATGRPWLGTLAIEPAAPPRSLLLLGEDDADSAHRLISRVCDGLGLLDADRELVDARVDALPLLGHPCALAAADPRTREVSATAHAEAVLRILDREAQRLDATGEPSPYGLIVVDTSSRFGPAETEVDSSVATRFCQVLERLTAAPGGPAVLALAHVPKSAKGADPEEFTLRGSSALENSARYVLALLGDGQTGLLWVAKANFAARREKLQLVRTDGLLRIAGAAEQHGILRALDEHEAKKAAEKRARKDAAADAARARLLPAIVEQVGACPGIGTRDLIAAIGGTASTAGQAISLAATRGLIVRREGAARSVLHFLPGADPAPEEGDDVSRVSVCEKSPTPPSVRRNAKRAYGSAGGTFRETSPKRRRNTPKRETPKRRAEVDRASDGGAELYSAELRAELSEVAQ